MKVAVTWRERTYFSAEIELDKVPETDVERAMAQGIAADSDSVEMGDTYVDEETFEEVEG